MQRLRTILTKDLSEAQRQIVVSPLYKVIQQLQRGDIPCENILEAALLQQQNTAMLRSFMPKTVSHDSFYKEKLEEITKSQYRGSLFRGIPFGVKDNFCTTYPAVPKGEKSTAGSKILENFASPYNATVVERIIQSEGVIIGKTALDEFGMGSSTSHCGLLGPTLNPWNLLHHENLENEDELLSAGGSSGGSATAVASYCCYAALGSDTGGSVRQPAAWNGIVGLKPSYGTLSRFGLIAYGSSLDCPGIFTRNIADSALVLDKLSGPDFNDNCTLEKEKTDCFTRVEEIKSEDVRKFVTQQGKPLRVGLPKEYWVEELAPEIVSCWRNIANVMGEAGAEIVECSLPHTKYALPVYLIIANAEASSNLARYDGVRYGYRSPNDGNINDLVNNSRKEALGNEVQRRIIMGTFALSRDSYESFFLRAQLVRRLIKEDFDRCFQNDAIDVMLMPTAPSPAKTFKHIRDKEDSVSEYLNDLMTIPANLAGIPAVSLPVGMHKGLPLGMQLMAQSGGEQRLLEVAAIIENNVIIE